MDTWTGRAVDFGAAVLVLLVLQQLFFARAVMAHLREGRRETAQAFDALHEMLTKRLEKIEARLRRAERRFSPGRPRTTDTERTTPRGSDSASEQRCQRASAIKRRAVAEGCPRHGLRCMGVARAGGRKKIACARRHCPARCSAAQALGAVVLPSSTGHGISFYQQDPVRRRHSGSEVGIRPAKYERQLWCKASAKVVASIIVSSGHCAAQGQKESLRLDALDAHAMAGPGLSCENQVGNRASKLGLFVLCQRRLPDAPGRKCAVTDRARLTAQQ